MDYKENEEEKHKVNEPIAGYDIAKGKTVRIFHSFAEAEAAEDEEAANKSPIQRIRDTVQLILRTYGVTQEMLNKRKHDHKITIIKYE